MEPKPNETPNPQNEAPQPDPTFSQEMPNTEPAVPAVIEGETVHTNPTPEAPVERQPMIRKDENGTTVVDFSDKSRKTLAICTLILSICSVLLGIVWPVAALIAIAAIAFGIAALAKHHGGKGMSIAGIVIGGISLLILVPFWAIFTTAFFDAFNKELDAQTQNQTQSEIQRDYDNLEFEEGESEIQNL